MAPLLPVSTQTPIDSTGWQDMRRQLFGQQHQRDAEQRLIRLVGEVHARLSAATGGLPGAAIAPKRRGRVLGAVVEGANQLIAWHRNALLAEQHAGRSTEPLPGTAQVFLAEAQAASPLFESARIVDGTIDCADVVQSVASLRGAEGDGLFNEVLAGMATMLIAAFELIAGDPVTAPAAAALGETWEALIADVAALAVPEPEPAPEPILEPESVPEPISATEVMISPPAPVLPFVPDAATPLPDVTPILAARFSRIQLVAC